MISRRFEVNKPWVESYLDFWEIVFDRMGFITKRQAGDLVVEIANPEDEYILAKFLEYEIL